nr:DUF6363 domain-containing protein [Alteromonas pelagimontana]
MDNPPADCKVTILAPSEHFKIRALTMDKLKLTLGYREGKKAAGAHLRGIKENEPLTVAQAIGGV